MHKLSPLDSAFLLAESQEPTRSPFGAAVNVMVLALCDAGVLYFGLISARRTIPHLEQLRLAVEEAFAELKNAAAALGTD